MLTELNPFLWLGSELKVDSLAYGVAISACGKGLQWHRALGLLGELLEMHATEMQQTILAHKSVVLEHVEHMSWFCIYVYRLMRLKRVHFVLCLLLSCPFFVRSSDFSRYSSHHFKPNHCSNLFAAASLQFCLGSSSNIFSSVKAHNQHFLLLGSQLQ